MARPMPRAPPVTMMFLGIVREVKQRSDSEDGGVNVKSIDSLEKSGGVDRHHSHGQGAGKDTIMSKVSAR